jgi:hypothetical protein
MGEWKSEFLKVPGWFARQKSQGGVWLHSAIHDELESVESKGRPAALSETHRGGKKRNFAFYKRIGWNWNLRDGGRYERCRQDELVVV